MDVFSPKSAFYALFYVASTPRLRDKIDLTASGQHCMSYSSVVIAYGDGFAGNKSLTFRHLMPIINTSHKAQQTSVTASSTHFESLSFIQSTSDISSEVI